MVSIDDSDDPLRKTVPFVYGGALLFFSLLIFFNPNIGAAVALVSLSGVFSGLTIGILGLSIDDLIIETEMGNSYAKAILPVRKKGNLLLCTLLIANVIVNSVLSIFLSSVTSGIVGAIVAIGLITIFGEIVPQSLSIRYGLRIGFVALPLLKIVLAITYPISMPLAFLLDKIIGQELPATYSKTKLSKVLQQAEGNGVIDKDEERILLGGVTFSDKTVSEVMTSISNVFALSDTTVLDKETIAKIYDNGYSRVPVFHKEKNNFIGLLFVKKMIAINPDDQVPVVDIMNTDISKIFSDEKLDAVLNKFWKKRKHLFVVYDNNMQAVGIVTLEDIIEEILQTEIIDETDFAEHGV